MGFFLLCCCIWYCKSAQTLRFYFLFSLAGRSATPMEEAEAENRLDVKTRSEKRKQRKKIKRKQIRKEVAEREREIEEARLNDPEELKRLEREQAEEREARERALKEFQDRERAWIEAMERKKVAQQQQQEQQEDNSKEDLEQKSKEEEAEDGDWEYIEEGPAEIIWNGNEITVRKKKVRVPKKDVNQMTSKQEDAETERPTSNPLPPQSQVFSDYLNTSSAQQQVLKNVAKEIPNFGTEKDKANCPFHLKTGACRFGESCSRGHFKYDKSQTLLIKNMYDVSIRDWEQDEQLELPDEEVERSYEEFYDDVHSEFLKFGEIVNFKVCRNSSSHLRGNVYVHYKSLESAILAYGSINGRYFAKKQVNCEFVNVTKWRVAICGEFMRSRLKTCSRGMSCNFIHCFRIPGGEYEWADKDDPPPKYWQKKMAALFGYSDESGFRKEIEHDRLSQSRNSSKMITWDGGRKRSRRSRTTERECVSSDSDRSRDSKDDIKASTRWKRPSKDDRKHAAVSVERLGEERRSYRHNNYQNERSNDTSESFSDVDIDGEKDIDQVRRWSHMKKTSRNHSEMSDNELKEKGGFETYSRGDSSGKYGDRQRYHGHLEKRSRARSKWEFHENDGDRINVDYETGGDPWTRNRDKETNHSQLQKSSKLGEPDSPYDHLNSRHYSSINTIEACSPSPNEELKSRKKYESSSLNRWEQESPERDLGEHGGELDRWRPESPEDEVHRSRKAATWSKSRSRERRHSRSGHKRRSEKESVSTDGHENRED